MQFSAAVASIILAMSPAVMAVPAPQAAPAAPTTVAAANNAAPTGLSRVQQLMLAPLASDRYSILTKNEDFTINLKPDAIPAGKGGNLKAANRKTFDALVGTGAGMAVGVIAGCGVNTFHVHPRSAELQIVIEGTLVTEQVPENGVLGPDGKRRVIRNTMKKWDMTPFYQGSVHHQYNPNCEDAYFIASFASEDFGTGSVIEESFAMDKNAIIDTFGATLTGEQVQQIKDKLPPSIVKGVESCMKKCPNVPKPNGQ